MSLLKKHKQATINKFCKHLISGYTRDVEEQFHLQSMPLLITNLIAIFYYITEHFARANEDCVVISENKLTITSIQSQCLWDHTVYLDKWIDSTSSRIITWTFMINKLKQKMWFGFASRDYDVNRDFWQLLTVPCYSIENNTCNKYGANSKYLQFRSSYQQFEDLVFKEGCQVSFTLDLADKKIWCKIDDNARVKLFDYVDTNAKIKYKMVMSLMDRGDSVTILSCYQHT